MTKHDVLINENLCIGCGLCASDCVAGFITVKDQKAKVGKAGCIACGHCEAICPQNAITLTGFEDESETYDEQTRLDPNALLQAIKTRRTIRQFTSKAIEETIIQDILEAGRLAPTGGNSQSTGYILLESKKREAEDMAVHMFRTLTKPAMAFLKNMTIDEDFFFKKAPLVIVITGSAVNASLAAENMAFMAEAHGLGVLYSGFFTACANHNKKLHALLGLGKKQKVVTTLVIGYPAVKYHRTVRREPIKLTRL